MRVLDVDQAPPLQGQEVDGVTRTDRLPVNQPAHCPVVPCARVRRLRLTAIVEGPPEVLRLAKRTAGRAGCAPEHLDGELIVYGSKVSAVIGALKAAGHDVVIVEAAR